MCIPGLGENRPRPRVLGAAFFGYVPDAFSMKTPDLPSERQRPVHRATPTVSLLFLFFFPTSGCPSLILPRSSLERLSIGIVMK